MQFDYDQLEKKLASFNYEIETEDRLVRVGLKEKLDSVSIYKKYRELFTVEVIEFIKGLAKTEKDPDKKEILERVYFYISGNVIGLKLAKKSDLLTTYFASAKVKFEGKEISYYDISPRLSKDPIYNRREIFDDLSLKVVVKAHDKELALVKEEIALLKTIGWKGYLDYTSVSKNMDYAKFEKVARSIVKKTDKVWDKTITRVVSESFNRPFKRTKACHMAYLRTVSMFDAYYPKEKIVPTFKKFTADIGLDGLLGSIEIDDVQRPKKNPRAVCYWADPPKEVHLVIKPIGGEQDYEAMFHEGGHALHAASQDPLLPYVFKNFSRSNALTETYAFILEDLVFEPAWLSRYLNVSAHTGVKIKWQTTFVNLMLLRRYLGKFLYEYEMFSKGKIATGGALYAKTLEQTTGFIHRKERYLDDLDPFFYSADYLRAWIASAQIKDYLNRKYGKEWFFNPKVGQFFKDLWKDGVMDELETVVKRLGYEPWDIDFLVESYASL